MGTQQALTTEQLELLIIIDEIETFDRVHPDNMPAGGIKEILSVCSLSNLFFRFHTTTLTEACSNELKQHHL